MNINDEKHGESLDKPSIFADMRSKSDRLLGAHFFASRITSRSQRFLYTTVVSCELLALTVFLHG